MMPKARPITAASKTKPNGLTGAGSGRVMPALLMLVVVAAVEGLTMISFAAGGFCMGECIS
jgi:hypothetical protein